MLDIPKVIISNQVKNVTVFTPHYPELIFLLEGICIIIFLLFIILVVYQNRKGLKDFFLESFENEENED